MQVFVVYSYSYPYSSKNFSKTGSFKYDLERILSTLFDQEMDVPQGNIFSVTFFALKINSIVKAICTNVECSLYFDDFLICYR